MVRHGNLGGGGGSSDAGVQHAAHPNDQPDDRLLVEGRLLRHLHSNIGDLEYYGYRFLAFCCIHQTEMGVLIKRGTFKIGCKYTWC